MKSDVETLSQTRVRLTVEVPFEELRPSVDAAYRKFARQVRVKGFRPGKVPPRLIDQQLGRGPVLEEAVNTALPGFYGEAVREQDVVAVGHPEVSVTEFGDGAPLKFTAEVDVRPPIELPAYTGIAVTVDAAEPSDDEVGQQVDGMRERFATLTTVERPAAAGDYLAIDLATSVDGSPVEDASARNLSYQVGSGTLLDGLDPAVTGLSSGAEASFATHLSTGRHAGEDATVTVTVRSVREKELPPLDDDFARTGSEFDTLDELRADVRERLARVRRLAQGMQARDRVLDALLDSVEVPMPEHVLADEVAYRRRSMDEQLEASGLTREDYAKAQQRTVEDLDRELDTSARQAIKSQFVLDAVAQREQLDVSEQDLTDHVVRRAGRAGVLPEDYARQLVEAGQLPMVLAEARRGKALALVLEQAEITDTDGNPVDLDALTAPATAIPDAADSSVSQDDEPSPTLTA